MVHPYCGMMGWVRITRRIRSIATILPETESETRGWHLPSRSALHDEQCSCRLPALPTLSFCKIFLAAPHLVRLSFPLSTAVDATNASGIGSPAENMQEPSMRIHPRRFYGLA